jgi:hypothetical protein
MAAAFCLAACGGGTGGTPGTGGNTTSSSRPEITFRVEGTGAADITWSGVTGGTAAHVTLPWRRISRQDASALDLSLTVVLGGKGGDATCSIAVDGRKVASSLASGVYGRAACRKPTVAGSNPRVDG